jgi:hypothetical protein
MNLRVRSVTGESESAILAVVMAVDVGDTSTISEPGRFRSRIFPLMVIFAGCCARVGPPKVSHGIG